MASHNFCTIIQIVSMPKLLVKNFNNCRGGTSSAPAGRPPDDAQQAAPTTTTLGSNWHCSSDYNTCEHNCLGAFGNNWKDRGAYCASACFTPQANGQRCFNADGDLKAKMKTSSKTANFNSSDSSKLPGNADLAERWTIRTACNYRKGSTSDTDSMSISGSGGHLTVSGARRGSWGQLSANGNAVRFVWTSSDGSNVASFVGQISGTKMSGTHRNRTDPTLCSWAATKN
jgi:hypothetical protein